jgi:hypothetical protein
MLGIPAKLYAEQHQSRADKNAQCKQTNTKRQRKLRTKYMMNRALAEEK